MRERLYKSTEDRMLSGVSGGLAEYLEVDPTLVRIAWVIAAIMSAGTALLVYIALIIIVPTRPSGRAPASLDPSEGRTISDEEPAEYLATEPRGIERQRRRGSVVIGVVLVAVGVLALGYNLDLFDWLDWSWFWPVFWPGLLILLGVLLIARRSGRS